MESLEGKRGKGKDKPQSLSHNQAICVYTVYLHCFFYSPHASFIILKIRIKREYLGDVKCECSQIRISNILRILYERNVAE